MPRLDVRLDAEQRRRLDELAAERGAPISEVVRRLIDDAYEDVMRKRRLEAVERMANLNVEDVPDPAELSRELEKAHEPRRYHLLTLTFPSTPPAENISTKNPALVS